MALSLSNLGAIYLDWFVFCSYLSGRWNERPQYEQSECFAGRPCAVIVLQLRHLSAACYLDNEIFIAPSICEILRHWGLYALRTALWNECCGSERHFDYSNDRS